MRTGHPLHSNEGATFKDKPLRLILYVINPSQSIFEPDFVRLECGHNAYAWGLKRARCKRCRDNMPMDKEIL